MVGKKRLFLAAGTLASIGAVVALATGVTFGFFSATSGSQINSFTAGTVTLTSDATALCTVTDLVPGDSSTGWAGNPVAGQTNTKTAQCELDATYGGSVPAYLGLDLKVASQTPGNAANTNAYAVDSELGTPVTGADGLFDGTAAGLQLQVMNGATNFIAGGVNWTDEATTTHNLFGGAGNDLYLGQFSTGGTVAIKFDYALPQSSGNAYQAAGTTFRLQVHAVQAGNNDNSGCVVGQQCSSIAWS